jgi:hypothetical protein
VSSKMLTPFSSPVDATMTGTARGLTPGHKVSLGVQF